MTIQFNSIDKTNFVEWRSFKISNILTRQIDTCSFIIKNYGTKTFVPVNEDDVKVYDGATLIFAGVVERIVERVNGAKILIFEIKCADYTRLADRKRVAETYSEKTVNYIIDHIKDNYLSGFTDTNVDCDIVLDFVAFNYESPSKCFEQLADLVGYDWYIDYDKDIHFFTNEANPAPFDLSDDGGKYIFESLKLKRDTSQLRNIVYVRGGEYLGDWFTENQFGDATKRDFKTAYKYSSIEVKVAAVAKTVGIDNVDDPADYDCLYNFNEKVVKFRADNKPGNAVAVDISGYPYAPVIVEASDTDSIDDYGEFEYIIIDKSIKTKKGARERGAGELKTYATKISEGSFKTYESGLKAGQKITIQSTIRDINEEFIINRVDIRMRTFEEMEYTISLVSTKTFGIIETLAKLLLDGDKKIAINEDEVVDKLWTVEETIEFTDSTPNFKDATAGPWYVSGGVGTPVGKVGFCQAS